MVNKDNKLRSHLREDMVVGMRELLQVEVIP